MGKKNKKRKGGWNSNNDVEYYDNNVNSYDTSVRFGEQAERPPTFRQIPRGAKKTSKATTQSSKSAKGESMSEHQIEAEKNAMELMRRRVQAQYKAIKSR